MPVYLFTYHGYATWMPDRRQGYVHHTRGLQEPSEDMGRAYRRNQREREAFFDDEAQQLIIDTVRCAGSHFDAAIHAISVEPTHVHVLISWAHERDWKSMRASIKTTISRALNEQITKRTWLSKNASRKRIRDRGHFDHHMLRYLPSHRGAKWFRTTDVRAARQRAAQRSR